MKFKYGERKKKCKNNAFKIINANQSQHTFFSTETVDPSTLNATVTVNLTHCCRARKPSYEACMRWKAERCKQSPVKPLHLHTVLFTSMTME